MKDMDYLGILKDNFSQPATMEKSTIGIFKVGNSYVNTPIMKSKLKMFAGIHKMKAYLYHVQMIKHLQCMNQLM